MSTSKFVLAASLVLASTASFAVPGDEHINDWSTFNSNVTREQVKAELREATRLGLMSIGEGDAPVATAEQERLIAQAGQEAAEKFAKANADAEG